MFSRFFAWLKSFVTSNEKISFDLYTIKERKIYHYYDGQKLINADPMILYKKIMEVAPELHIDIKVASSASKDASKAHDNVINKIRSIFSLKSLEQGGLTEAECYDLLTHFISYTETLKKNLNPSPTLQTATLPPIKSTPAEEPPTSKPSGCGLTEKESTIEKQGSSVVG